MAVDPELKRLYKIRDQLRADEDQISATNLTSSSFESYTANLLRLKDINDQIDRINLLISRRQSRLIGAPDPVWGTLSKKTRTLPDFYKHLES